MNTTQASVCAREIQTDNILKEGVFDILGEDHVVMFKDGSMLMDAKKDEGTAWNVMKRHGYERYGFKTTGAEMTFWNLRHGLPSGLFVRENGESYHVVMFTGWESENGDQMRQHPRFLEVEDLTKVVQACNEAEEISDEDLEACEGF